MTRAAIPPLALLLAGCLISPTEEDRVFLTVAVGGTTSQGLAQQADKFSPWDSQDQFYLTAFPKYVRVSLEPEGQDYEQGSGTWPDPQLGIGAGEGPGGEVDVSLDAPPGSYRLRVLGYVVDAGRVLVWGEEQPRTLALDAGQSLDLTLHTRRLETGRVAMSVQCQQGSGGTWVPDRVVLWDARAAVFFLPHELGQSSAADRLEVEIPAVPVGRQFWTRVIVKHAGTGEETAVDVRKFFGVEQPHERVPVSLVIPCTF